MMRRLFWFALGVVSGAYGVLWVRQKATAIGEKLTLSAILHAVLDAVKFLLDKLIELLKKDAEQRIDAPAPPSQN